MAVSSINVTDEQIGQAVPQAIRPVAVKTQSSVDYQVMIQAGIVNCDYGWTVRTLVSATQEKYEFYSGGSLAADGVTYTGGSIVCTTFINYTSSTLETMASSGRLGS